MAKGVAVLSTLHKSATTTPARRLALQQASGTDRELAQQYGIGVDTVRKWRHRTTVHDSSHTANLYGTVHGGCFAFSPVLPFQRWTVSTA